MFDTYVTIVGNVLTAPEWRRTSQSGTLVTHFKVASTARRIDKESGRWVDGNSLRVRVTCWRRLAEGVAASVMVGDPIMVAGRMYTRDWTDETGTHRTLYELEAVAVGHDLSRGRAKFLRNRPNLTTSTVEDDEAEARVRGEVSESVPLDEAPVRPGEVPDDNDGEFPDATVEAADAMTTPDVDPSEFPFRPVPDTRVAGRAGTDPVGLADLDSGTGSADGVPAGFGAGLERSVGIGPDTPVEDGPDVPDLPDRADSPGGERAGDPAPGTGPRGRRGRVRATVPA